jgi:tellurite methyltransferase
MSSSPFVAEWLRRRAAEAPAAARTPLPLALDVAMGRGRHALLLARSGFRVFGVDWDFAAVAETMREARRERLPLLGWCADVTVHPIPRGRFDAVVVTRFLDRALFPAIRDAVAPGGVVVYETFTTAQLALGVGPRSPDHLLMPGELRAAFADFDVTFYEEVNAPEAVARIVARKPPAPDRAE